MKVVLFGATGMIGGRILDELVLRGHEVTAVVRDPSKVKARPSVNARAGNVLDAASVAETVKGADAVISAYKPPFEDVSQLLTATKALLAGLKSAGVKRMIMVGGAGNLDAAPGVRLVDTPNFPADWKEIALAHCDALDLLKASDLDWTSLSPAGMIEPGVRTGKFRLGTSQLVVDEKGESRISAEDYAIAMVDELEQRRHIKQRFTIGY